jgi:hypothetical protein
MNKDLVDGINEVCNNKMSDRNLFKSNFLLLIFRAPR